MRFNHLHDFGVRNRVAFTRHIVIPACAGFLAKTALFAQQISRFAVLHVGLFKVAALADRKTNVVTRQVPHAERAHGKAKFLDRLVHLCGCAAFV